ncbi:MAG: hypothetical protein ABID09_05575 [Candidatus Omnitrophota bacterium]
MESLTMYSLKNGIERFKDRKGMAFVTTLLISVLMVFIAMTVSNLILQDYHMVKHLKYSMQAQLLAEAGISVAMSALLNDGFDAKDIPGNFPETLLGDGTYDVTVVESGGRVLLSSLGVVGNVSRTVIVEVDDLAPEAMSYALGAGGDVDLKADSGDITVKGNLHANNDMRLKEQGTPTTLTIQAEGTSTGRATASDKYCFPGGVPSGSYSIADEANSGGGKDEISMPNINFLSIKAIAQTGGGVYYSSGQSFDNANLSGGTAGIIYVNGDVTFTGTCTITGGFVAQGDITINNGNSVTQTHDAGNRFPIFMSEAGNRIKLYGVFSTVAGNIVYATNDIQLTPQGAQTSVLGCVIAGGSFECVAKNNLVLTYAEINAPEVVPSGIVIVSWNR